VVYIPYSTYQKTYGSRRSSGGLHPGTTAEQLEAAGRVHVRTIMETARSRTPGHLLIRLCAGTQDVCQQSLLLGDFKLDSCVHNRSGAVSRGGRQLWYMNIPARCRN